MPELVPVREFCPHVIEEIRYFTRCNFLGVPVDGYLAPKALLTREAALGLGRAEALFLQQDLCLRIYDAYRPQRAVDHFVRWARDIEDTAMKPFFYPDVDKQDLFRLGFIAERSGHTRGSTVDLTLFDMRTGQNLDMGSPFDFFGEISHFDAPGLTALQRENRRRLRDGMIRSGFVPYDGEWWHFTLRDEPFPDTYFDLPITP